MSRAKLSGILADRYEIQELIGSGAFADVYRASDTRLSRTVAIKKLRLESMPPAEGTEIARKRFLQEAEVAARLKHPNIVTLHDVTTWQGHHFMVLELIDGETVRSHVARHGRLTFEQAAKLLSPAAEALDYAHREGVVHRDIKPSNLMIDDGGTVKVADFGIAKFEASAPLTIAGSLIGTPNYMSPEQVRGLPLDGRSDLFSLACVLYECVSGERAFDGPTVTAVLLKILDHEPPLADLTLTGSVHAQDFLAQALAKEPGDRFASGAEFASVLRDVGTASGRAASKELSATAIVAASSAKGGSSSKGPATAVTALAPLPRPVLLGGVLLVALVLGSGGFAAWKLLGNPPAASDQAPAIQEAATGEVPEALRFSMSSETAGSPVQEVSETLVSGVADPASTPTLDPFERTADGGRRVRPEEAGGTKPPQPSSARAPSIPSATQNDRLSQPATAPPSAEPVTAAAPPPPTTPVERADSVPTVFELPPGIKLRKKYKCSVGADFDVSPESARIEINGQWIGTADDWDGSGGADIYRFPSPGVYHARVSREGHETSWVQFSVSSDYRREIAEVDFELDELDD